MVADTLERPAVSSSPAGPPVSLTLLSPRDDRPLETFSSTTLVAGLEHILQMDLMPLVPRTYISRIDEWGPLHLMEFLGMARQLIGQHIATSIRADPQVKPTSQLTALDASRPRIHYTKDDVDVVQFSDGINTDYPEHSLFVEIKRLTDFVATGFQLAASLRNNTVSPPLLPPPDAVSLPDIAPMTTPPPTEVPDSPREEVGPETGPLLQEEEKPVFIQGQTPALASVKDTDGVSELIQ